MIPSHLFLKVPFLHTLTIKTLEWRFSSSIEYYEEKKNSSANCSTLEAFHSSSQVLKTLKLYYFFLGSLEVDTISK